MTQSSRTWRWTSAAAGAAALGLVLAGARRAPAVMIRPLPPPPVSASPEAQRDRDIALFTERAAADPLGAADRSKLAELFLSRSRETGSFDDLHRAETAARASLALRTGHNSRTSQLLASILLAEHRFVEARDIAAGLSATFPDIATFRALFGECQLELGDYEGADTTFAPLKRSAPSLAVAPRVARWHEINGRTDNARRILVWARDAARAAHELPAEQLAWFELRVGDLELRHGNLIAADSAFKRALAAHPGDYRVLGLQARLELLRGNPRAAVRAGESALGTVLEPATLGALADAYALLGDSVQWRSYADALMTAVARQPGSYHRAWSLWLLEHGRSVPHVAGKVAEELETRRDVYGLDLQAWALHAQGRDAEAGRYIKEAMSRGTEDAQLFIHAAAIAEATGDSVGGKLYRDRARIINPFVK